MDLNIYNLCFTVALFGPPRVCHYAPNNGWNGIDTSGTILLRYPDFVATLGAAKDSNGLSFGCIQGEKGYIEVKGSVSVMEEFTLHLNGEQPVTFKADMQRHRLSFEFEEFLRLIENRPESKLNIPYLSRTALEIAIAVDKAKINSI